MRSRKQNRRHRTRLVDEASDEDDIDSSASEMSEFATSDMSVGEEPFLEPEALCREHNMKIHSWH